VPHVKIRPAAPLAELMERLEPLTFRDEAGVLKTLQFFMERGSGRILVEALVAEGGLPKVFFLSIAEREGALVLRCYGATDPEKTPAVKRLIARAGADLAARIEGSVLDTCNLDKECAELGLSP